MRYKNLILATIVFLLFFLPFLWFYGDSYNIGGDDTRLYFIYPIEWLNNISNYSWFNGVAGGLGTYNPQHFYITINILSGLTKNVFFFLNYQAVIYGLFLSLSFIAVYLIIFELLERKTEWSSFLSSVIGGIFYVFIPIIFTLKWSHPISSLLGILAFPLLFLFFLNAIKRRKISEIIRGGAISLCFGMALIGIPGLLPFFIGIFIFFFLYFLILEPNRKSFVKYLFIYIFLIILINSFWIIPFLFSTFQGNPQSTLSLSSAGKEEAVWTIRLLSAKTNLLDHLSGISGFLFINVNEFLGKTFNYFFKTIHLGIVFFGIIIWGLLVKSEKFIKEKKILLISVITLLCVAFLITANIGNWGIPLFAWFMRNIPGFVAIRNFWTHVAQSYGLFYAITLGLACYLILNSIKRMKIKIMLISFIFLIILIQALPFISGKVVNLPIRYPKEDAQIYRSFKFSSSYLEMISYLKNSTGDSRVLSLPLIIGSWSMILSEDKTGAYIGGSPIKVIAGKDDYNSNNAFKSVSMPELNSMVKLAFEDNDYYLLKNIITLLNIKYLVYDTQIYDEHAYDFDKIREEYVWIYKYDGKQRYKQLIDNLPVKLEKTFGQWEVYKFDLAYVLPHIYSSQKLNFIQGDLNSFIGSLSLGNHSIRDGVLLSNSVKENSFVKEKINKVFLLVEADSAKIASQQLTIDKTTDPAEKKKLQNELDLYATKTFIKDYRLSIPSSATYKIYFKKDSILGNNLNTSVKINDRVLKKDELGKETEGWNYFSQVDLDKGEYDLKLYIGETLINAINSGDIVLAAENLVDPIKTPQLEYKQINPTKYIVNVTNASESFPLIFSESFHPAWKIYVAPDLAGQGTGQFISENNQGTVQNDNLNGGHFYDLMFRKPVLDDKHLLINGFANAWWVDINELVKQGKITKNADGTYNFSVYIEFEPQKYFYIGLGISGITLIGCLTYLVYDFIKRRKKEKMSS